MTPLSAIHLADQDAERVRQSHARAIEELQGLPATGARVLRGIAIPNGSDVTIAHGLGRKPLAVLVSPPQFANPGGTIREFRNTHPTTGLQIDGKEVFVLAADGWGVGTASIIVDVVVF